MESNYGLNVVLSNCVYMLFLSLFGSLRSVIIFYTMVPLAILCAWVLYNRIVEPLASRRKKEGGGGLL